MKPITRCQCAAATLLLAVLGWLIMAPGVSAQAEAPGAVAVANGSAQPQLAPVVQVTADLADDTKPAMVEMPGGKLLTVYERNSSLWSRASVDGGATWGAEMQIEGCCHRAPSLARAANGSLWLTYDNYGDIWYRTSVDQGISWTPRLQLTNDPADDFDSAVFQAADGWLWIVWSSYRGGINAIWYKISTDGGVTWSDDAQATPAGYAPAVAAASGGRVVLVWNRYGGELWQRSTADGGATWSDEVRIAECCRTQPSMAAVGSVLWLAYANDGDIWYRTSANQGATWSGEASFTHFAGPDADVGLAALASGSLGLAWRSVRSGNSDIWFGIPGERPDDNPPPYVEWIEHRPPCNPDSDDTITFRASARDETSVAGVHLEWTLNGVAQPDLPMYDDGAHGDDQAGDGIWGVQLTPLPVDSQVTYTACATDDDNNSACVQNRNAFTVQPAFVKTADILFVPDYGGADTSSFRAYFTDALDAAGLAYDTWDTGRRCAPNSAILNQYSTGKVIWSAPYYWSYLGLNSDQRTMLQNYLDAHGKLFVTGQDIASAAQGTAFLRDYLHASYVQYNSGLRMVAGMGWTFAIAGGDGANNQSHPDEIDPLYPAQTILSYTGDIVQTEEAQRSEETPGAPGAVDRSPRLDALVAEAPLEPPVRPAAAAPAAPTGCIGSCTAGIHVNTNGYGVVYLAFGFEAIDSATSRNCVMRNALDLLDNRPLRPCPLSPAEGQAVPPGNVTFRWSSVPDATSYEIQVLPDGIQQIVSGTSVTRSLTTLGGRTWRVRVAGAAWTPYSSFAIAAAVVQVTTDPADDTAPALVQAAGGKLLTVFGRNGGLWSRASTNGGATWGAETLLDGCCRYNPSLARMPNGTLWLLYDHDGDIWHRTSADQGATWSPEQRLTVDPAGDYDPAVSATAGRLWVAWRSFRSDYTYSIWTKSSTDGGATWSAETRLSSGYQNNAPAIVATPDNRVVVIWQRYDGLRQRRSDDGGVSWSEETQIADWDRTAPSLAAIGQNLWLAYDRDGDIWLRTSADRGITWSDETRFTRFMGSDGSPAIAALTSNKPALAWMSNRSANPDIWFGIADDRQDISPPPYVQWIEHNPAPNPDADDVITFRARALDETAVTGVALLWTLNDVVQAELPMYDDGAHGDNLAGDGVWGVYHGALPVNSRVAYRVRATDGAGQSYRYPRQDSFKVLPAFVKTGETLFVPDAGTNTPNDTAWFRPFYTSTLEALGITYDTWDTELRGEPDSAVLGQYTRGVVIWAVPYFGYATDGGSNSIGRLQAYLQDGGHLFITGQNIAQNVAWTSFFRDYLHAAFVQGDTGQYALAGVAGDPIGNGLTLNISGGDGANNQYSKDEVDPIAPAEVVFTYQTGANAMLAEPFRPPEEAQDSTETAPGAATGSGTAGLRVDTGGYKVVYFAFGFEAINSSAKRMAVMDRIVHWMRVSPLYLPLVAN